MNKNYVIFHLHSDVSNSFTTLDSVTKYKMYIDKAKELGMKAVAFSEHGHCMEWVHKKEYIEANNLKYIHAVEAYVTKDLTEKIRDNMHIILIARNWEGVKEINFLMSDKMACNRKDGHFYYQPRLTIDEVLKTSNNIIITTACLGGILNKGDKETKNKFIEFMIKNKERCFLEIQHHLVEEQIEYNRYIYELHKKTNIPLIAGTDTHNLNKDYAEGRKVLQKAKKIYFESEEGWDLEFKSYDELVKAYQLQNSLPQNVFMEAIENTNVMASMIEEFTLDRSIKYPKLYNDSKKVFIEKIKNGIKNKGKYIRKYDKNAILDRIKEEINTYEKTKSIDFMLLQDYVRQWEVENGIYCGYGRGSVSGSLVAYLMGITEINSLKFDLNFFR